MGLIGEMFGRTPEGVEQNMSKLGSPAEYMERKGSNSIVDEASTDSATLARQYEAHKNLAEIL